MAAFSIKPSGRGRLKSELHIVQRWAASTSSCTFGSTVGGRMGECSSSDPEVGIRSKVGPFIFFK